jgi:hypothetical protein
MGLHFFRAYCIDVYNSNHLNFGGSKLHASLLRFLKIETRAGGNVPHAASIRQRNAEWT